MKIKPPLKWKGKSKSVVYRKSRRFDKTCRNHGGCPWCYENRVFSDRKRRIEADLEILEYLRRN